MSNSMAKLCSISKATAGFHYINDAVKTIAGQNVTLSQNDEIDTDMHFCKEE